jgi:hypothetical protein
VKKKDQSEIELFRGIQIKKKVRWRSQDKKEEKPKPPKVEKVERD